LITLRKQQSKTITRGSQEPVIAHLDQSWFVTSESF
jgi:hypothetical protein